MKPRPFLCLSLAVLFLAGCSSIASRIKEKAAVFATLDAATQAKVRQGVVEIGYTPDLVYMALGSPDETRQLTTNQGRSLAWIYNRIYHEFVGTAQVGYERVYAHNPKTGASYVYLEPVYTDVYRDQIQERIRIVFQDGKVAVIEQVKP